MATTPRTPSVSSPLPPPCFDRAVSVVRPGRPAGLGGVCVCGRPPPCRWSVRRHQGTGWHPGGRFDQLLGVLWQGEENCRHRQLKEVKLSGWENKPSLQRALQQLKVVDNLVFPSFFFFPFWLLFPYSAMTMFFLLITAFISLNHVQALLSLFIYSHTFVSRSGGLEWSLG